MGFPSHLPVWSGSSWFLFLFNASLSLSTAVRQWHPGLSWHVPAPEDRDARFQHGERPPCSSSALPPAATCFSDCVNGAEQGNKSQSIEWDHCFLRESNSRMIAEKGKKSGLWFQSRPLIVVSTKIQVSVCDVKQPNGFPGSLTCYWDDTK